MKGQEKLNLSQFFAVSKHVFKTSWALMSNTGTVKTNETERLAALRGLVKPLKCLMRLNGLTFKMCVSLDSITHHAPSMSCRLLQSSQTGVAYGKNL